MDFRAIASTLLDLAGASLLTVGAWLVYQPAAFVVAGVALLAASYAMTRGPKPLDEGDGDDA